MARGLATVVLEITFGVDPENYGPFVLQWLPADRGNSQCLSVDEGFHVVHRGGDGRSAADIDRNPKHMDRPAAFRVDSCGGDLIVP